jgi:hypothetical protein
VWRFEGRPVFGAVLSAILLILASLPLIFAFEAHVINVTATIENPECKKFEIRSRGYWKTHEEDWILPQTVGPEYVETEEEAEEVFDSHDTMAEKLARELLALKFNIAHFGLGSALVPGDPPDGGITIDELAWEADQLLAHEAEDPDSVSDDELEEMKDRVEKVNNAKKVSTCKPPPDECKEDGHDGHGDGHDFPDFPEFPDHSGKKPKLKVTRVEAGGTVMVMTPVYEDYGYNHSHDDECKDKDDEHEYEDDW